MYNTISDYKDNKFQTYTLLKVFLTHKFVPLQDFTKESDIDWSKTTHEIDLQLYKKYNLLENEINYIENKIKEME